jgi:hypothetical protein
MARLAGVCSFVPLAQVRHACILFSGSSQTATPTQQLHGLEPSDDLFTRTSSFHMLPSSRSLSLAPMDREAMTRYIASGNAPAFREEVFRRVWRSDQG